MTTTTVAELKQIIGAGTPVRKPVGDNLYFRLNQYKVASWEFRYVINGKRRYMTIGNYPQLSLKEAREVVIGLSDLRDEGKDPLVEKKRAYAANLHTCEMLFQDWYKHDLEPRIKHANIPYRIYNKYIKPILGELSVGSVTPLDVRNVLISIREKDVPTICNDALMYMKQMFRHAIKLGLIDSNPAASFTTNDAGGVEDAKSRALSESEIAEVFRIFRENISSFGRDNSISCCLFLMLGVRKSELCEAKWSEFDLDEGLWTLPKERMKTGVPITIPLPTQALTLFKILKVQAGFSEYVFPARRASKTPHMGSDTLNRAITKCFGHEAGRKVQPKNLMGDIAHFSVHDLRRTFRTHCAKLGISGDVAERCLNHKLKGVEGIYDRHDYLEERRVAHQRVADALEEHFDLKSMSPYLS